MPYMSVLNWASVAASTCPRTRAVPLLSMLDPSGRTRRRRRKRHRKKARSERERMPTREKEGGRKRER
eukprot:2226917-Rhodomonas_salina.1